MNAEMHEAFGRSLCFLVYFVVNNVVPEQSPEVYQSRSK